MPCLLKVISNIRVWNGSLTIACFPASSNLGRSLVCFLLWQCLVISFLCLLGLAFLMKLCSLETPKWLPISVWYCFGWSTEFPNEILPIFSVCNGADPAGPWSTQKTGVSYLCNRGSVGKWQCGYWMVGGTVACRCLRVSSLFVWWEVGGTLPEAAVHGHWHVPLQAHGLSPRDIFFPVRGPVVLCRLQAPTCPPQAYLGWFLPHAPARKRWRMGSAAAWGISGKSGT